MDVLTGLDFETAYYIILAIFALIFFLAMIMIKPFKTAVLLMIFSFFVYTVVKKFVFLPQVLQNALLYADELFCLSLFAAVLLGKALKKSVKLEWLDLCLAGFIVAGLISSMINDVPAYITILGVFLLIKGYLFFWAVSNIKIAPKDIDFLVRVLKIFGWIFLFFGVIDFFFPGQFRLLTINSNAFETRFGITSVISLFTLASVFGWFMSTLGLLYASEYLVKKNISSLFKSAPFFIFVILSMRLKPILATSIALLWFLFFIRHSLKGKISQRFAIIILICTIGALFFDEIKGLMVTQTNKYLNPSVSRSALYMGSFKIAKDHFPLGAGFGRYGGYSASRFYSPLYFKYGISKVYGLDEEGHFLNDTFWPCVLGETGYTGLLCYLLFLFQIYLMLAYLIKTAQTAKHKAFAIFVFLIFIAALVDSIAQPVFTKNPQYFLTFFVLGIARNIYFQSRQTKNISAPGGSHA